MITLNKIKNKKNLISYTLIYVCLTSCQILYNQNKDFKEYRLKNAIILNPKHELGYIRLAQYLENKRRYSETFHVLRSGQKKIPNSINLIRLEGILLDGLGYEKESITFYAKQILKKPNNELLYIDRAKMRWNKDKKFLALSDARKALRINPESYEALFLIGVILSQFSTINEQEKLDLALESLIQASEINNKHPDLWLKISAVWESKKNIHMAKIAMFKAVELSPDSESYLQRLALLLEKGLDSASGDDYFNISESLRKTLLHMRKLFPDNPWVNAHFGSWAWTQGKFSLAEKYLKNAIKFNPIYPWAHFRLASVYMSQSNWEFALLSLEEGLTLEPKNKWGLQKKGLTLEMLDKNNEAIEYYEKLIKDFPMEIFFYDRLSNLYLDEFLFKKAEETILFGLKIFPSETKLIERLVDYYESIGNYENAKNILLSFIKIEPNNAEALTKIGFFEKKLNKHKNALKFFKKALKISPDLKLAKFYYVRILLEEKKFKIAEKELETFLKHKPNSEWALIELSKLKIKNKQFENAEYILKNKLKPIEKSTTKLQILAELYKIQKRWKDLEEISLKLIKLTPHNSIELTNLALVQWRLKKIKLARENVIKALYENSENFLAWNLHFILRPQTEKNLWIGKDNKVISSILNSLVNKNSSNTWEEIKSVRVDPFIRQILKNLYYVYEGFSEKIILDPEDMTSKELSPWILEKWGFFHQIKGNNKLAAIHFENISKKLPNNTWIHARLGFIYEKLKKLKKSSYHYSKFLKKHPKSYEISFRLAHVQMILGEEESTIDIYEKIISKYPDNDLVLNNLAWIFLTAKDRKLRNVKRGLELALKSVEIFPTIDNLDTLAEAYFQSGKIKKAIKIMRESIRIVNYPESRQAYLRNQFLRFQKGDQSTDPPTLS